MRRVLPLLLAVALVGPALEVAAAPTAGAQEAPSFDFVGGGFGHGVGMSQYGAHGMAAVGYRYDQILTHYYQGTTVQAVPQPGDLRVLLGRAPSTVVTPTAANNHGLLAYVNGVHTATFQPNEPVTVWANGPSSFTFQGYPAWAAQGPFSGTLELRYVQGEPTRVSLTNQRYQWGALRFLNVGGSLNVIVAGLSMERYLYGLGEMPSSWELEALKVQAVAGRSYAQEAVERRRADAGRIYDLDASVIDQAYIGYEKEAGAPAGRWRSAVDATASQVARYGGKTIQAFYSSSSGGHTENSEIPFSAALPYARGVPDPHDGGVNGDNTLHQWRRSFTQAEMTNAMAGLGVGTVTNLFVNGTIGVSGRIDDANVRVTGSTGTATITGVQFRSRVNSRFSTLSRQFPSTKIAVDSNPFGNIELVSVGPGVVRVAGWALDPNTDAPIDVHVYIGPTARAARTSTVPMSAPPSGRAPPTASTSACRLRGTGPTRPACTPSTSARGPTCSWAVAASPPRSPRSASSTACSASRAASASPGGPSTRTRPPRSTSTSTWGAPARTAPHRPTAATSGPPTPPTDPTTASDGWSRPLPAGRAGAPTPSTSDRARRVRWAAAPSTCPSTRTAASTSSRRSLTARIAGWAIDPDTGSPIDVHLYVGSIGTNGTASTYRGDVGAAYPAYGPYHGFDRVVPVDPTGKDVCAYAINQGAGTTTALGCRRF